jgi:hypothetical protein
VPQYAEHGRGHGVGFGREHAALGRARVARLDDDAHSLGLQSVGEPVSDLFGQPFLHLRTAGKVLHYPGQFRQTQNPVTRQLADMGDTHERQQVVFAHRPHRDRARQYQLVVVLVVRERRQVERARREQLGVGPGHPLGSVAQALGVKRNAQRREELASGESAARPRSTPRSMPTFG